MDFWKTKEAKGVDLPKYWEEYQDVFLGLLGDRLNTIDQWLSTLNPAQDYTLLCWEKAGEYCHRNDVGQFLAARVPEQWGGFDVLASYQNKQWVQSVHAGAIGQIVGSQYIGERICYRVQCVVPDRFVTWLFADDMVPSVRPQSAKGCSLKDDATSTPSPSIQQTQNFSQSSLWNLVSF